MRQVAKLCGIVASAGMACTAAAAPGIVGLGDIAGGDFFSEAFGVNGAGTRVVGYSINAPGQSQAVVWENGVLTVIGDLPLGAVAGVANAVSDGGAITGQGNSANGVEGFKWNGGRFRALGGTVANGLFGSSGLAINSDGRFVAGQRELAGFKIEACIWEAAAPQGLGWLSPTGFISIAYGISGDASTVVGQSDSDDGNEAFYWTALGGMQGLGDLDGGGVNSQANAISRDGTTIVGFGTTTNATLACKSVDRGPLVSIGDLPGGFNFAEALAVSADGSVIVGRASSDNGIEAFVWTQSAGMRSLASVLQAGGVDLNGWQLSRAAGISDDGTVIVGTGVNPNGNTEGFIVTLPPPCPADFNGDGFVDFFDFDDFVSCFEGTACPDGKTADFNNDGFVDFFDFDDFVVAFETGC
jgi:uncharacterized membrane protein